MSKACCAFALFLILSSVLSASIDQAGAQDLEPENASGWSIPFNLSQSPDLWSAYPRMTVDPAQNVHVVWSQNTMPTELPAPDTIVYSALTNGTWSDPVDVLASESGKQALATSLSAHGDALYLLWVSGDQLYLSTAPIEKASSARAWATQSVPSVGGVRYADMAWDNAGRMLIALVGASDRSVYLVVSEDEGTTFSDPQVVLTLSDQGLAVSSARLAVADDVVHLVYTLNSEELGWNSAGVGYIRSVDGGVNWQDSWETDDFGDDATVQVDGKGTIHVMWNRSADGGSRGHRWSSSQGAEWSTIAYLWPGAYGRTGFPGLAIDSLGDLHVFTSHDLGAGLYHAVWKADSWGSAEPVIDRRDQWGERPWLVISHGNQLHAVYMSFANRDVWYVTKLLDTPEIASIPLEDARSSQDSEPAAPTVLPTIQGVQETASTASSNRSSLSSLTSSPSSGALPPLVFGIASAFLLVLGVVVLRLHRMLQK